MANRFNIVAEVLLQGPKNLRPIAQQIQKQLGGIKTSVDIVVNKNTARNLSSTVRQLNQINVALKAIQSNSTGAAAGLRSISQSLGVVNKSSAQSVGNITKVASASQNAAQQVKQAGGAMATFGAQSALATKRFLAFSVSAGAILGVFTAMKRGVGNAVEFQTNLIKIAQASQKSIGELKALTNEIDRLSIKYGVLSKDLSDVSLTLIQANLSARDTKIALEALAKTDISPTFGNIKQTTEGAIAIMNQFGVAASDLEASLGSLDAVSAKYAVESEDLIAAIQRTGGAFKASGGTLNELAALFTSVRQTTRESAETIAAGFRTIFTRLQRKDTIDSLKRLGIQLVDINGKFVGPFEAIQRLGKALEKLPKGSPVFTQIAEELGGIRQISKIIPLLQQTTLQQEALNVALAGTDTLDKNLEVGLTGLARSTKQVSAEFDALFRRITEDDAFKHIADSTLTLTSHLIKLADTVRPVLPLLTAIGALGLARGSTNFARGYFGGAPKKFATGGYIPGSGNTDSQLSALTPGEFVIKKSAAQKLGPGILNQLNSGNIPRFRDGGDVDDSQPRKRDHAARNIRRKLYKQQLNKPIPLTTAEKIELSITLDTKQLSPQGQSNLNSQLARRAAGLPIVSNDILSGYGFARTGGSGKQALKKNIMSIVQSEISNSVTQPYGAPDVYGIAKSQRSKKPIQYVDPNSFESTVLAGLPQSRVTYRKGFGPSTQVKPTDIENKLFAEGPTPQEFASGQRTVRRSRRRYMTREAREADIATGLGRGGKSGLLSSIRRNALSQLSNSALQAQYGTTFDQDTGGNGVSLYRRYRRGLNRAKLAISPGTLHRINNFGARLSPEQETIRRENRRANIKAGALGFALLAGSAAPTLGEHAGKALGSATLGSGVSSGITGGLTAGFLGQSLGAGAKVSGALGIAGIVVGAAGAIKEFEDELRSKKIEEALDTFGKNVNEASKEIAAATNDGQRRTAVRSIFAANAQANQAIQAANNPGTGTAHFGAGYGASVSSLFSFLTGGGYDLNKGLNDQELAKNKAARTARVSAAQEAVPGLSEFVKKTTLREVQNSGVNVDKENIRNLLEKGGLSEDSVKALKTIGLANNPNNEAEGVLKAINDLLVVPLKQLHFEEQVQKLETSMAGLALEITQTTEKIETQEARLTALRSRFDTHSVSTSDLAGGFKHVGSTEFFRSISSLPISGQGRSQLANIGNLQNILPKLLDDVFKQFESGGLKEGEQVNEVIAKKIRDLNFGTVGEQVATEFQKMGAEAAEKLKDKNLFEVVQNQLKEKGAKILSGAEEMAKDIDTSANKFLEISAQVADRRRSVAGLFRTAGEGGLAGLRSAARFNRSGNTGINVNAAAGLLLGHAGVLSGGATSIEGIQNNIAGANAQIAQLNKNPNSNSNLAQLQVLKNIVNDNIEALRVLADSTHTLADAEERLSKIESVRQNKLSQIEQFIGADAGGRLQIGKENRLAQLAVQRGGLGTFSIQQQQQALAGLNRAKGLNNAFGTGLTGDKVLENILRATPGADKFLGAEDEEAVKLQKQILATNQVQYKAQLALANVESKGLQVQIDLQKSTLDTLKGMSEDFAKFADAQTGGNRFQQQTQNRANAQFQANLQEHTKNQLALAQAQTEASGAIVAANKGGAGGVGGAGGAGGGGGGGLAAAQAGPAGRGQRGINFRIGQQQKLAGRLANSLQAVLSKNPQFQQDANGNNILNPQYEEAVSRFVASNRKTLASKIGLQAATLAKGASFSAHALQAALTTFAQSGDRNAAIQAAGNAFQADKNPVTLKYNRGGIVPGTGNTDSVNARLTPGEAVLPKDLVAALSQFGRGINTQELSGAMSLFSSAASSLVNAMNNLKLPSEIQLNGHFVHEVIINGADIFRSLGPELTKMVDGRIQQAFARSNKRMAQGVPPSMLHL